MYAWLAECVCVCLMAVKNNSSCWINDWCIDCCSVHRDTAATATNIDRQHSRRTNVLVTYLWHSDGASLPLRAQKEGLFTVRLPVHTHPLHKHKTGWIFIMCVHLSRAQQSSSGSKNALQSDFYFLFFGGLFMSFHELWGYWFWIEKKNGVGFTLKQFHSEIAGKFRNIITKKGK